MSKTTRKSPADESQRYRKSVKRKVQIARRSLMTFSERLEAIRHAIRHHGLNE